MLRRVLVGGLLAVSVAACGGGSSTPSPEPATPASTAAPVITPAPEPSVEASAPPAARSTATAVCDAVSLRKSPATTGELVGRAYRGTKIRIVETVTGEVYTAGSCGTSGDGWHKIDRVGGKSVKSLFGVPFVYSAAGFYE